MGTGPFISLQFFFLSFIVKADRRSYVRMLNSRTSLSPRLKSSMIDAHIMGNLPFLGLVIAPDASEKQGEICREFFTLVSLPVHFS
jgi:hypothetical protein